MPPESPPVPITEPQIVVLLDDGPPAVTPWKIKQLYINRLNGAIYQATTLENTGWVLLNYSVTPT